MLRHALMHLEENKIDGDGIHSGWYNGNRDQFIKRHVKTKAFVRSLLEANDKAQFRSEAT